MATAATESESMKVPLLDLKAQYDQIETKVLAALQAVCAEQHFILGRRVKELERRVAAYCQCRYGVGVSSGTDALLMALMALGIGPDDEVITSPYTFFATGGTIARVGARPVFCDIDPQSFNLSPVCVERFVATHCERRNGYLVNRRTGGRVRAMIPVHLFGQVADMAPLSELARHCGLYVIEDAAQAIGAEYSDGRRAGSMGDIGCFSFFPSKNLGAFGDGGMCTTNDPQLAERLEILRVHGGKPKYHHATIGGNFRLDELQAAVLLVKLPYLDQWTAQRQQNARYYGEALRESSLTTPVVPPYAPPTGRHVFNQYVLRVAHRDDLKQYLTSAHIGTEIYYPVPLHRQPCFRGLEYTPDDCPEAVRAAEETLAIPIYAELKETQRRYVVDAITAFYA